MIEATEGGSLANSYVTLADAEAYFAGRLGVGPWQAADAGTRERALLMAARALERLRWHGERMLRGQALAWPRVGAAGAEDGMVPPAVKAAQCEEALALLTPELVRRRMLRAAGVSEAAVLGAREAFRPLGLDALLSPEAQALLAGWVRHGACLVVEG